MLRAGIHELIPVIIIVAVGLALTFAVVGYMLGIWGHLGYRSTELLKLGTDSHVVWCTLSNGTRVRALAIQFFNPGLHDIVVYRIEVLGYGSFVIRYSLDYWGPPDRCSNVSLVTVSGAGLVLRHGAEGWFYVVLPEWLSRRLYSGQYIDVKVYTRFGVFFLQHVEVD